MDENYREFNPKDYTVTMEFVNVWDELRKKHPESVTLERDDFGVTHAVIYYDTHIVRMKGELIPPETISVESFEFQINATEIKVEERQLDI